MSADVIAKFNQMAGLYRQMQDRVNQLVGMVNALQSRPTTVQEEIDAIPGRRIETRLGGEVVFTAADAGKRSLPINILVSQDGPFIMTHYPIATWYPSNTGATNFGRWRPVRSYPLPTQQLTTDIIDIKYELTDGGSQRLLQNVASSPVLSTADNIVPCPIPTQWQAASTIVFTPTYVSITFNTTGTATTEGTLHVDLVGYRIVNM